MHGFGSQRVISTLYFAECAERNTHASLTRPFPFPWVGKGSARETTRDSLSPGPSLTPTCINAALTVNPFFDYNRRHDFHMTLQRECLEAGQPVTML